MNIVGSGKDNCIFEHPDYPNEVLSISKQKSSTFAKRSLIKISNKLLKIDPNETMFIRPRRIALLEYRKLSKQLQGVYSRCVDSLPAPTDMLLLYIMTRASPIDAFRCKEVKPLLQKLYENNIIHRDIHEGNIMLHNGHLVLIDWSSWGVLTPLRLRQETKLVEEMIARTKGDIGKFKKKEQRALSPLAPLAFNGFD